MSSFTSSSDQAVARYKIVRRWGLALLTIGILTIAPMIGLELWVRSALFERVSYTNSVSLDHSLKMLRSCEDCNVLLLGDSEVRWGFDPAAIDDSLKQAGIRSATFNLGIDGFSSGLYFLILPYLGILDRNPQPRVVVIGVQMMEPHGHFTVEEFRKSDNIGALQRPVLESAFAVDTGMNVLVHQPTWQDRIAASLERPLASIRYRRQIRHAVLGKVDEPAGLIGLQSTGQDHHADGYQPHIPYRDNREDVDRTWRGVLEEKSSDGLRYSPLDPSIWNRLVEEGGYFDVWARSLTERKVLPVFVALPTNPRLIDIKERRADYLRNSALLRDWAAKRNVVFIDLGIRDSVDSETYFSDHRHLSGIGAPMYSAELGRALAQNPLVGAALSR